MADAATGPQDDRLTQMVQAAVSASLARRSAILKPRDIQELTADARTQLEDLIRQRDADIQRMALLERARETLQEEIQKLHADLQARELTLEESRKASVKVEQRLVEVERMADDLRGALEKKTSEAQDVEGRIRGVTAEAERAKAEAAAQAEGSPARAEAAARAKQLEEQLELLRESRALMQREMAGLLESLKERERELEEERQAHRGARDRVSDLQKQVQALAEATRQKRGIELKVFDEMSRAQSNLQSMVEKLAGLDRTADHGPVVAELRKEVERVREAGREERVMVAQLQGQLRDMSEAGARANAAAVHLRETLAAVEADRDRLEDLLRKERRGAADRQRTLVRRLEELENRPPIGADPGAYEKIRGEFDARLREASRKVAESERAVEEVRTELENARALLTRATVERQTLRARLESLELASVGPSTDQLEAAKSDMKRIEYERDDALREVQALKSRVQAVEMGMGLHDRERQAAIDELEKWKSGGLFTRLMRAIRGS